MQIPTIEPLGDCAILVRLAPALEDSTPAQVQAACAALARSPLAGCLDVVPGYTSVVVHYDPVAVPAPQPYEAMAAAIMARLRELRPGEVPPGRTVEIAVVYGREHGPDLADVAAHAGLPPREVVRLHAAREYLVHMIGFMPGFPYLGGLDPRIACPRLPEPRRRVPAGSVGIAGTQTGVYPLESPGGWRIIGRTPLALFDAGRDPPALLRPGDRVRFVPVEAEPGA